DTAEPSVPQYHLLVGALRALTEHRQPPDVLLDSFKLRSLAIAGYAPSFDGCARCGAVRAPAPSGRCRP
ncbi:MAG: DNA repair protein RecO C-terminal domain-containing protein, partial [Aeromicrobium sp.]